MWKMLEAPTENIAGQILYLVELLSTYMCSPVPDLLNQNLHGVWGEGGVNTHHHECVCLCQFSFILTWRPDNNSFNSSATLPSARDLQWLHCKWIWNLAPGTCSDFIQPPWELLSLSFPPPHLLLFGERVWPLSAHPQHALGRPSWPLCPQGCCLLLHSELLEGRMFSLSFLTQCTFSKHSSVDEWITQGRAAGEASTKYSLVLWLVQRQGNEWTLLRVPFGLFLEKLDHFRLGHLSGPQALMGAHQSSVLWQNLNQDMAH